MKLAIAAGTILLLILTPTFLLPRMLPSDSQNQLVEAAARQITWEMAALQGVQTVRVERGHNDLHGALQFELIDALRKQGRFTVLSDTIDRSEQEKNLRSAAPADSIITAAITHNQIQDAHHRIDIQATLISPQTGQVLWTTTWQGEAGMTRNEWEQTKTGIILCLLLAAGILVLFARKETHPTGYETIR